MADAILKKGLDLLPTHPAQDLSHNIMAQNVPKGRDRVGGDGHSQPSNSTGDAASCKPDASLVALAAGKGEGMSFLCPHAPQRLSSHLVQLYLQSASILSFPFILTLAYQSLPSSLPFFPRHYDGDFKLTGVELVVMNAKAASSLSLLVSFWFIQVNNSGKIETTDSGPKQCIYPVPHQ